MLKTQSLFRLLGKPFPKFPPSRHFSLSTRQSASASSRILLEKRHHVQWVTLNRPAKYNALTLEMFQQLIDALNGAAVDPEVRFLVLTGTGDYYSSGNDLSNFLRTFDDCDGDLDAALELGVQTPHRLACAFIDFPKPIIGVINGPALGIMVTTLALMDCLIASETATFTTPFSAIGQTPGSASTVTFPRLLGPSLASQMLYFNYTMNAQEALQRGFLSQVVPKERLLEVVEGMLYGEEGLVKTCYPNSMMNAKALINSPERRRHLREVSQRECELLRTVFLGDEFREALVNFFNRK